MILAYTLSMPHANSWNGKWSGEGQDYIIIRSYRGDKAVKKATLILQESSFWYRWSDGWCARVDVKEVTSTEARKLRKKSCGFSGYDWMVKSIETYRKIYASHEEPANATT